MMTRALWWVAFVACTVVWPASVRAANSFPSGDVAQYCPGPGFTVRELGAPGANGVCATGSPPAIAQCHFTSSQAFQYCIRPPLPDTTCPANSRFTAPSSCTCNAGYAVNATNNGCVAVPACEAGSTSNSGFYNVGTSPGSNPPVRACSAGCEVGYNGGGVSQRQLVDGQWNYFAKGEYVRTGEQCQSGDTRPSAAAALPPATCAAGHFQGQVNGVDVCLTPTGKVPNPHAAPQTKETGVTVESTAGGGTRTTEVTSGSDGTVTTTTTERDGGGRVTGVSVVREGRNPLEGFCAENPSNPLCSKSAFGGTCSAGHTCEGDAATCAIARAAWLQACDLQRKGPVTELGDAILGGTDPAQLPNPGRPTQIPVGTLDLSGWGLARSCLADDQITIPGFGSFVIPWSVLCGPMQAMGLLLVAASMIGAVRIVGVKGQGV